MNDYKPKIISYAKLVDQSLRQVVIGAINEIINEGYNGKNYFVISFDTQEDGVVLSDKVKCKYPESITIVLQNQFKNLEHNGQSFSVDLSFGGVEENITVPYSAIESFTDPYANFSIGFGGSDFDEEDEIEFEEMLAFEKSTDKASDKENDNIIKLF